MRYFFTIAIKNSLVTKYKLMVLMLFISCTSYAQSNLETNTKKQIDIVFKQLITVFGSTKSVPEIVLVKKGKTAIAPAKYTPKPIPKIEIDVALYKICQSFGKDSLNAIALVLSHELTHYYNDHLFCSDYAFANLNKNNPQLAKTIQNASLFSRKEKETEADIKGFFFAAAAGFQPYGLQEKLIEKIYKIYNLPDIQNGYPTKQQRKIIAQSAETEAARLYGYFKAGLKALEEKKYDEAISAFKSANGKIPYRENLNNMGVARVRKALLLKLKNSEEDKFPDRFLYPIEIENKSRLNKEITRSLDDNSDEMEKLLKDAQMEFQEAISLDPSFTKGYINLACVLDLLGNYPKSIGTILELPKEKQNSIEAKRILAIAYFHDKQENKANAIWNELKM